MMDVSELGITAADLMDRLAEDYDSESEPEIGVVAVIAEVNYKDSEGVDTTAVEYRCSDGRRWLQIGLFSAALRAVTDSNEPPAGDDG